ncbi:MAG: hypothetical protein KTR15_06270 [Phycisphaeraceae bacterium]|nr:hypothetical protein [Phycisphaeraceae bacterium]
MSHKTRIVMGLLAFCVAQAVLVLGLGLLLGAFGTHEPLAAALALIAASLLLAMTCVIDPLVPEAGKFFTAAIKLITLVVLLVCTSHVLYSVITGHYDLPGLS